MGALVERALRREGARATLVADGQQALDCLRAHAQDIDAVLMDIQMPVMDGLTATRAIRQALGLTALPVIAFSAGGLRCAVVRAAHRAGALAGRCSTGAGCRLRCAAG